MPFLSLTGKLTNPRVVFAPSAQVTGTPAKRKQLTLFCFECLFCTTLKPIVPAGVTVPV